jgi:hypothetical protein
MKKKETDHKTTIVEIGFYPGILIGFRTYVEENYSTHVLYLPFVDLAISTRG